MQIHSFLYSLPFGNNAALVQTLMSLRLAFWEVGNVPPFYKRRGLNGARLTAASCDCLVQTFTSCIQNLAACIRLPGKVYEYLSRNVCP